MLGVLHRSSRLRQGGAQTCFSAVTFKSEGNRPGMWNAGMDGIPFPPGSLRSKGGGTHYSVCN